MPVTLSGGEQQRLCIARAVVHRPAMLLADEPTGNLDAAYGREIGDLFCAFNQVGVTVVIATHDGSLPSGSRTRTVPPRRTAECAARETWLRASASAPCATRPRQAAARARSPRAQRARDRHRACAAGGLYLGLAQPAGLHPRSCRSDRSSALPRPRRDSSDARAIEQRLATMHECGNHALHSARPGACGPEAQRGHGGCRSTI